MSLSRKTILILSTVSVGTGVFCLGAAAGYLIASRKLEAKYVAISEKEIAEAKKFYSILHKEGKLSNPVDLLEELVPENSILAKEVERHKYVTTESDEVQPFYVEGRNIALDPPEPEVVESLSVNVKEETVTVKKNIFITAKEADDDWDWDKELALRSETDPYIIHYDEFEQGEKDYVQSSLTYFTGDDTLVDEHDQIIDDIESIVGDINVQRFGYGSKDNNIVYIRNDRLSIDFEVVQNDGKYVEVVLGVIEHADRPGAGKARKFRGDDGWEPAARR